MNITNTIELVDDKEILIYKGSNAGKPFKILVSEKNYNGLNKTNYTRDLTFPDGYSCSVLFDDKITFDVLIDNIRIFNSMYNEINYMVLGDKERMLFIRNQLKFSGLVI